MDTVLNQLISVNMALEEAIKNRDKVQILEQYEVANKIKYHDAHESEWDNYDALVSEANDILYS